MKIAFIGIGVMGRPMALHLCDAGHEVHVYNRTFEKAKALEPKAIAFNSIVECIKDVDVIMSIVGYPSDVIEVYDTVIEYARKGTILCDMTTSSPSLAVELYDMAKLKGLSMLDAPVTGGDLGAIKGTLSIMVGGDESAYHKVYPLLKLMGTTITYMGASGSGMHAKLANQTVIAGNIIGIAEALTYAKEKNLDLNKMLSVITGGSAGSWQAANNGPKMINHDYQPGFYVKHYLKDLKLVLEEKGNLKLEIVEKVTKAYQLLSNQGFADLGTQSIIEFYLKNMNAL